MGGGDIRALAGVSTRIERALPTPDGRFVLECRGTHRIRVHEWLPDDPYPLARVRDWPDEPEGDTALDAAYEVVQERTDRLFEILSDIARSRDLPVPEAPSVEDSPRTTEHVWEFASGLPLGSADRAKVLTAASVAQRLDVLATALDDVIAIAEFSRLPDV